MKKNMIVATVILLSAAALGGVHYYRQQSVEVSLSDIYQTHTVTLDNVSQKVTGSGSVETREKVSLYINSSQTVSKVHVKEGDRVEVGDVLVEYDTAQDLAGLNRSLNEAQIQLQNAQLNLKSIEQSAVGNELVQYNSDITTAQKNITDAEAEIITAQKNISDAEGDIASTEIKIAQQQLRIDDAKATMDANEILLASGSISKRVYDDSVTVYKNAQESLNDLLLQKETKERTLETRIMQEEFAHKKLETRLVQAEYAEQKLKNAQDRLSDETTAIQYELQKNIIALNQIAIEQIQADIEKLVDQTVSPVNGNIVDINAVEGGTLSKGVPAVTISDTSTIIVKFDVGEYDAPAILLGQKVDITTSALPDRIYHGIVAKIAEEAIEMENSSDNEIVVPVEIALNDMDEKIKIGYSVDIEIYIKEANNVLSVPIKALVSQDDGDYVYLLRDNNLEKTEVSTGLFGDKTVEIINGLKENDMIVLDPEEVKGL